ncbi:MAG: ribbon-helix-helix protein, CopG family [Chromatiales bacterium]|nr:ribbon-helix-helix protein, CopG family [Chromatiales bacterium]
MSQQVTARLPDPVVDALDSAARQLRRSRADVIRQAVERYLQDFDDLSIAIQRLRDPGDPVLDWDRVRRELLDSDWELGSKIRRTVIVA